VGKGGGGLTPLLPTNTLPGSGEDGGGASRRRRRISVNVATIMTRKHDHDHGERGDEADGDRHSQHSGERHSGDLHGWHGGDRLGWHGSGDRSNAAIAAAGGGGVDADGGGGGGGSLPPAVKRVTEGYKLWPHKIDTRTREMLSHNPRDLFGGDSAGGRLSVDVHSRAIAAEAASMAGSFVAANNNVDRAGASSFFSSHGGGGVAGAGGAGAGRSVGARDDSTPERPAGSATRLHARRSFDLRALARTFSNGGSSDVSSDAAGGGDALPHHSPRHHISSSPQENAIDERRPVSDASDNV
jgi:hypothetical protein